MKYLETLLQSAQEEAKRLQDEVTTLRATLDHKWMPWDGYNYVNLFGTASNTPPRTASGYEYSVTYENSKAPKPLAFDVPVTPCTAELEVRLQKLAAYFTKRAKENSKRAEKLDYEVRSTFLRTGETLQKSNSAYFFSGKADTYLRVAGKVLELLGQQVGVGIKPAPAETEQWIIEFQETETSGAWLPSTFNGTIPFSSKEAAEKETASTTNGVTYRVRRIGVAEKWIVKTWLTGSSKKWVRSFSIAGVFTSREEAEQAIVKYGSKSCNYKAVKETQ